MSRCHLFSTLAAATAFVCSASVAAQVAPPAACEPDGDVRLICGQKAAEDFALIPGSEWVATGWYGEPGGLKIIHSRDKTTLPLYPAPAARDAHDRKTYPACPGPLDAESRARLIVAGVTLLPGRNGRHRLFVVQHSKRDGIEIFEIDARSRIPTATWVGCVPTPNDKLNLNSVVPLRDGGFYVSSFNERGDGGRATFAKMREGAISGEVWEWHPGREWVKVPGSESSGTNGIALSADGKWLYIDSWGGQSIIKLSLGVDPPKRQVVPLGFRADNLRWSNGALLSAGQIDGQPGGYRVVRIDPDSMQVTTLVERQNTPRFGYATSAIQVNDEIWVGTYRLDTVAVFPVPK